MAQRYKAQNRVAVARVEVDMNLLRRTAPMALICLVTASLVPGLSPPAQAADRTGVPTCRGERATIVGTDRSEYLAGTPGRDVIVAGGGNDRIRAGRGNDLVCAGRGADVIWGGPGDDRLYGETDRRFADQGGPGIAGDTLRGGPGNDVLDPGFFVEADTGNFPNTIAYDEAAGPVSIALGRPGVVTGEGRDLIVATRRLTIIGSAYADVIDTTSTVGDVRVIAGAGADEISTGAGADQVYTEGEQVDHEVDDDDIVSTGAGRDSVFSSAGADRIRLGAGDDVTLTDSYRPVFVDGGSGADQINATVHDGLVLDGGTGNNTVVLTAADEDLTMDRPTGTLSGLALRAVVRRFTSYDLNGGSAWTYRGVNNYDYVIALSAGPITMRMRGGDDVLWGSPGEDVLDGGPGRDEVHPGGGNDTCRSVEIGTC